MPFPPSFRDLWKLDTSEKFKSFSVFLLGEVNKTFVKDLGNDSSWLITPIIPAIWEIERGNSYRRPALAEKLVKHYLKGQAG
jgi:hypothetical protein